MTDDDHVAIDDVRVRRVAPGDAADLKQFYAELSADSRVSRFHGASSGISYRQAERFAMADHRTRDGFVAVAGGRIVGHLVLEPLGDGVEELAVAVDDHLQHHGVGAMLVVAAVASARLRGVRRLVAWVKSENVAMRHLLAATQHLVGLGREGPVTRYELELPPAIDHRAAA